MAKRYGHLVGKEIRTVGEAFAAFTDEFGLSINALYKNAITDIVGTWWKCCIAQKVTVVLIYVLATLVGVYLSSFS